MRRALKVDLIKGGFYPAFFLFSIFSLSVFQIKSYDLWWHLKAGESIVGAGLKPAPTNIFSWTEPDHPWINFSWLFDAIVYSIYKAAGFDGMIIFQAILVTAVFFVVYKTVSQFSEWHRLPACEYRQDACPTNHILILSLLLISYFAARFRFSLRPHLIALLIFAVDIYILNIFKTTGKNRLFIIPLLQIIWANVHGSAIVGVLLAGIFFIGGFINPPQSPFAKGGRKGDFFLILFLTTIGSLLNPYGYKVFTEPFAPFFGQGADLFNTLTVDEWQMPGKDMFFGWYGLLLAIGIISFFPRLVETPRRGVSTDLLLFSTFALLSIKALRFVDLFAVAAVPVIYRNVAGGQWSVVRGENTSKKYVSSLTTHHLSLFLILSLFWLIGIKDTTFTLGLGVDEGVIPKKAVEFMERNGVQGKIFNSYNFGGYLIYKDYPVFIDGRLSYSHELVKDFADANFYPPHPDPLPQGERGGWKKVEEKYRPDIVLVEYDKPAIPGVLIIDKKNWALVYWDDLSMLFLKRSGHFSDIISKNEYYLNPMDMYGILSSEFRVLSSEDIFTEARRRIKEGPESTRAHLLMGNLYMSRGEPDKAILQYTAAIDSPLTFGKAEAHNNLGTAYETVGDIYGAEDEYKAAIRLEKVYPLPQRNLGYLKLKESDYIEAFWYLKKYVQLDSGDRKAWAVVSDLKIYRDILILRVFIGGGAMIGILWIVARRFGN